VRQEEERVELRERRDLYNGLGDGLARAIELIATPAIFALLGFWLDRTVDLLPLFTVLFTLFGLVGTTYSTWLRYDAEMKRHEADRLTARQVRGAGG
jgi:F0F1-type ATP synthase assembly protein I